MKYKLEIIVFICGAVVMILELVGARVVAPYLGTSIIVWTGLIGIILGSLSLGYWLGGKFADINPNYKKFSLIIFSAAVCMGLTTLCKSAVLVLLQHISTSIRLNILLATGILFAPSSLLLGVVSPYAVKLKLKHLDKSGAEVGSLYAISTIGSIVGTFLAGFVLISFLGNTKILFLLSITLLATSLLAYSQNLNKTRTGLIVLLIVCFLEAGLIDKVYKQHGLILVTDSVYQQIRIFDGFDNTTKRPIRYLVTDSEPHFVWLNFWQSGIFLDGKDLFISYLKFFDLAQHFKPDFKRSLMIGGGTFAYPVHYIEKFVDARIDVVEIDPAITKLAGKYFDLRKDPRLTVYHEDGRTFLNKTKNNYDVVFIDTFKSFIPPFQLTTKEVAQKVYDLLADDGAVFINISSSIEGKKGKFLRAEYATFKTIFPQVYLFPVQDYKNGSSLQSIILVGLKSLKKPIFKDGNQELNEYLQHVWNKEVETDVPILTDDYAPVEKYTLAAQG